MQSSLFFSHQPLSTWDECVYRAVCLLSQCPRRLSQGERHVIQCKFVCLCVSCFFSLSASHLFSLSLSCLLTSLLVSFLLSLPLSRRQCQLKFVYPQICAFSPQGLLHETFFIFSRSHPLHLIYFSHRRAFLYLCLSVFISARCRAICCVSTLQCFSVGQQEAENKSSSSGLCDQGSINSITGMSMIR